MPAPPSPAPSPRRPVRSTALLGAAAVLLAVWLGTTAPSVSPVSAVGPAPAAAVPVADVVPDLPGLPQQRDRRGDRR